MKSTSRVTNEGLIGARDQRYVTMSGRRLDISVLTPDETAFLADVRAHRDYLLDLIDERFGSRYRFCKETGIDPGHLSRVFASRADLSIASLQTVFKALGARLTIAPDDESAPTDLSPQAALASLPTTPR